MVGFPMNRQKGNVIRMGGISMNTCYMIAQDRVAAPDYPVHHLLRAYRGPFDGRMVDQARLLSVLEAVRWTSSSGQAQPWSFVVVTREQPADYECLFGTLSEDEQREFNRAPVLILCMAQLGTQHPGQSYHDLGLAVGSMTVQARSLGLDVRQAVDFNRQSVRRCLHIPKLHDPVVILALGYPCCLPSRSQDGLPGRKPMGAYVFSGQWGRPLRLDNPPGE